MGTRSLTYIKDEYEHNDNIIICMYRQYVVNGYNMHTPARSVNGMGCLAAQLVAHFKDGIGNIYLYPPNTSDVGEEFIYVISLIDNQINIEVRDVWNNKIIFSGTPKEVLTEMEIINYGE